MTDLHMFYDPLTGRMIALGSEKQIKSVTDRHIADIQYAIELQRRMNESKAMERGWEAQSD